MDGLWQLLRIIAHSTRRLAVFVVGMGVVLVGIVLIPAPGPGWAVVFAGLALLATEFTWAEILLNRAKRQATRAKNLALRTINGRRQRNGSTAEPDVADRVAGPAGVSTNGDTEARSNAGRALPTDAASRPPGD